MHYIFEGHDTVKLAEDFGTPLYVISEERIERAVKTVKDAFLSAGLDIAVYYAGKAFTNKAMCRIVESCGIGLDTVSGGELFTALSAGFPANRIVCHGSVKTSDEIDLAVKNGVHCIVINSPAEIPVIDSAAARLGTTANVALRVSPGVDPHTHEYITTGTLDTKFGLMPEELIPAAKTVHEAKHLNFTGLHCHIGSQIMDDEPFILALSIMLGHVKELNEQGIRVGELNMGGGFGIPYLPDEKEFDMYGYAARFRRTLDRLCVEYGIPIPKIAVEPGRYIIGPAGITIYKVCAVKDIPGIRRYISVDGGLNDNPRPALYQARYNAVIAGKYGDGLPESEARISGRSCETDTLIDSIMLPDAEIGDIMVFEDTGAYCYSMAGNYNRLGIPKIVLLHADKAHVIKREQTAEDIASFDEIPDWLEG